MNANGFTNNKSAFIRVIRAKTKFLFFARKDNAKMRNTEKTRINNPIHPVAAPATTPFRHPETKKAAHNLRRQGAA